jgi:hypothetical protein
MDLETVLSRPAQLDCCEGILRGALLTKGAELRKSWRRFISPECLASLGALAKEVESLLSGEDVFRDWRFAGAFGWMDCDASFADNLRAIALAHNFEHRPSDAAPERLCLGPFNRLPRDERMEFLYDRYRCPLNIGLPSETDVAEELLRQLMVPDRGKLEAGTEFDAEMVLLKLNLVGVRAMVTRDLRYLDALNYFYELPRRSLMRMRSNPRLHSFWMCIYAQLLSTPGWQKCALR